VLKVRQIIDHRMKGSIAGYGLNRLRRRLGVDGDALALQPFGREQVVVRRPSALRPWGRFDVPRRCGLDDGLTREFVIGENAEPGWRLAERCDRVGKQRARRACACDQQSAFPIAHAVTLIEVATASRHPGAISSVRATASCDVIRPF
jgi:hypothetical protein